MFSCIWPLDRDGGLFWPFIALVVSGKKSSLNSKISDDAFDVAVSCLLCFLGFGGGFGNLTESNILSLLLLLQVLEVSSILLEVNSIGLLLILLNPDDE
jgi:hypothetical protein